MQMICGRILVVFKEEYNNTTEYTRLDMVTYQGSSYIAKDITIGNLPTDEEYWQAIVDIGSTMSKAIYDKNSSGVVDNAERTNNHIIEKDVPSDAEFTDTKSLMEMIDIDINNPISGEGLLWDDLSEKWENGEIIYPTSFSDLDDTAFNNIGRNHIPMYNESNHKWENVPLYIAPPVEIVTWANGTDEQIAAMLEAHYNDEINIYDYWAVGDERVVSLSSMSASGVGESHAAQAVTFVLSQKGKKTLAAPINGHSTCAFQVDQKNSLNERGYMNNSSTTMGGWESCARRSWCNSTYKNAIPATFRSIFKQFINTTGRGGGSSSGTTETTDTFALRSEREVMGSSSSKSVSGEGSQAAYYSTSSNRIKQVNGSNLIWFLRSPASGDVSGKFCCIGASGSSTIAYANYNYGIAPYGVI